MSPLKKQWYSRRKQLKRKLLRPFFADNKAKVCYYCKQEVFRPPFLSINNTGSIGRHSLTPQCATLDHLVPISRGGTNAPTNLVVACHGCNEVKADREVCNDV